MTVTLASELIILVMFTAWATGVGVTVASGIMDSFANYYHRR